MKSDDKKELTPFEQVRVNIRKTAENFNFYNSVEMLAHAINNLKEINEEFPAAELDKMCQNIMVELSLQLQEMDSEWN